MGWKAFALFATDDTAGYFGSLPAHSSELAEHTRIKLGLTPYDAIGTQTFDQCMHPPKRSLFLGAYPRGLVICEPELPCYFFDDKPRRRISGTRIEFQQFESNLLNHYPNGEVLAIVLHSVVNLWGYSLYSKGQLVRSAAGASDDGPMVNVGVPLPEEEKILRKCPIDRIDEEGLGEDLVFDVTARFLGKRIDEFAEINLEMAEYKRKRSGPASFIKKFFGGT